MSRSYVLIYGLKTNKGPNAFALQAHPSAGCGFIATAHVEASQRCGGQLSLWLPTTLSRDLLQTQVKKRTFPPLSGYKHFGKPTIYQLLLEEGPDHNMVRWLFIHSNPLHQLNAYGSPQFI